MKSGLKNTQLMHSTELADHGHTKSFSSIMRYSYVTHTPLGFNTMSTGIEANELYDMYPGCHANVKN